MIEAAGRLAVVASAADRHTEAVVHLGSSKSPRIEVRPNVRLVLDPVQKLEHPEQPSMT